MRFVVAAFAAMLLSQPGANPPSKLALRDWSQLYACQEAERLDKTVLTLRRTARDGEAYAAAYCASKAGLTHMTKALAMEYTHKPIRINAVAPGGMATNIAANLKMPPEVDYALIKRYSGLRGLVEVDDVAEMVAFLASDAARSYHGACISIDRGITAG